MGLQENISAKNKYILFLYEYNLDFIWLIYVMCMLTQNLKVIDVINYSTLHRNPKNIKTICLFVCPILDLMSTVHLITIRNVCYKTY